MRISKLVAAVVATSLFATPVLANTASSLSVAKAVGAKAGTSAKKSSRLTGAETVLAVLAAAAIAAGVAVAADSGSNNAPDSN
jgi:hypothetical protein